MGKVNNKRQEHRRNRRKAKQQGPMSRLKRSMNVVGHGETGPNYQRCSRPITQNVRKTAALADDLAQQCMPLTESLGVTLNSLADDPPEPNERNEPMSRENLRAIVRGAYDIQKLRIQMGNRIVANFKAKLGQAPSEKEDTLEPEDQNVLDEIRAMYKTMTEALARFPRLTDFKGNEVISTYTEICLVAQWLDLEKSELNHFKRMGAILEEYPIYTTFLKTTRGIGPAMSGVVISEIDIHKAKYPSSIWAYAGLDVASDGRGRSRRKEHLREVEYIDKDGKTQTRVGITFNPWLKTKLYVLGDCFMRSGGPYKKVYDDYKFRMLGHVKYGEHNDKVKDDDGKLITSKGRRDGMARRYMIKMFLLDLYKAWRPLEGLEVSPPYHEAKLGLKHAG